MSNRFVLITDGACSKNPGPGGWGLIFVTPEDQVKEFGGHVEESTNNRMELEGLYRGLQEVYRQLKKRKGTHVVQVISDSKYVLDGAQKFIHAWRKNGWKTVAGDDVKNKEMWEKVGRGMDELNKLGAVFTYELVKGHAGNHGNERADQIAVKFSRKEPIELYEGPLSRYPVSIESGPPFDPVYLSLVDGKLERHSTWDGCQSRVTGVAGARYKKVKNPLEEMETLKLWGLK